MFKEVIFFFYPTSHLYYVFIKFDNKDLTVSRSINIGPNTLSINHGITFRHCVFRKSVRVREDL
jgi:hypothetical protein